MSPPALDGLLRVVQSADSRLYWGWVLSFVGLSAGLWFGILRRQVESTGQGPSSFFGWLFNPRIWFHRSTLVDLQVLVAGALLTPARWISELIGVVGAATAVIYFWNDVAPGWEGLPATFWAGALCSVGLLLSNDFAMYWNHRLSHKIPALWAFHSVHHTAEVLTPLTNYRKHPVYDWTRTVVQSLVVGPIQGSLLFLFAGQARPLELLGVNVLWIAFVASTANLRHSQVPLRFGPLFGRIFSSPSQHHLHHSRDPALANCNFGTVFSLWDWIFGSLRLPIPGERLEFGVEGTPPHRNLVDAWLRPFRELPQLLFRRTP